MIGAAWWEVAILAALALVACWLTDRGTTEVRAMEAKTMVEIELVATELHADDAELVATGAAAEVDVAAETGTAE